MPDECAICSRKLPTREPRATSDIYRCSNCGKLFHTACLPITAVLTEDVLVFCSHASCLSTSPSPTSPTTLASPTARSSSLSPAPPTSGTKAPTTSVDTLLSASAHTLALTTVTSAKRPRSSPSPPSSTAPAAKIRCDINSRMSNASKLSAQAPPAWFLAFEERLNARSGSLEARLAIEAKFDSSDGKLAQLGQSLEMVQLGQESLRRSVDELGVLVSRPDEHLAGRYSGVWAAAFVDVASA